MSVVKHYWENGVFKVKHKPISRELQPWHEEHLLAAKALAESTNKPLYVLLSGGIDGEIVARSFLKLGIPFKAISVKHKQNTNWYDMDFAEAFCKYYNIEHKIVSLDIEKFFAGEFERYVEQGYRSTNLFFYQQLFLFEVIEELGGYGVSGEGDQSYCTVNGEICIKFNPSFMVLEEWRQRNNTHHELAFNRSTPELFASWMQVDLIDYLLRKPEYFMSHYYDSSEKILVYHRFWPMMRRRNKSSGFEQIQKTHRFPKEEELRFRFQDIKDIYVPIKIIKSELGI